VKKLFALALMLLVLPAFATPVGPINYQGRLLDNAGIPVTGSYNFVVKIYNDPTTGALKYQETLNGISVNDGVYAFKIGLGPKTGGDSLWDIDLWQGNLNDLYLEVVVNGETLTPRHELTSAPHAFTSTLALSLNGRDLSQFDNILEGICVTSKGKWLNKLGKCLGRGANIQNQTLSTMLNNPSDTNFRNLDLTGANLTGTNFTGVDFSGSTFSGATYSPQHFGNTNLNNTIWNAAIPVGALNSLPASAAGAQFTNMDPSGFRFSQFTNPAQYTGIVMAYMSACPAAISYPLAWGCQNHLPPSTKKVLLGPYGNYSATSPLATEEYLGRRKLDVAFYIYLTNLSYSDYHGTYISNWSAPEDGTFDGSNFRDVYFAGPNVGFSYMTYTGADFTNAIFDRVGGFLVGTGGNFVNTSFINGANLSLQFSGTADFSQATFDNASFNPSASSGYVKLNSALVRNTTFGGGAHLSSSNTTYDNVFFTASLGNGAGGNAFASSKFFGDIKFAQNATEAMTISSATFYGADLHGTYNGVTFTSNTFNSADFSKANFQGAIFTGTTNVFTNVNWTGAVCPNGIVFPGGGENCPN